MKYNTYISHRCLLVIFLSAFIVSCADNIRVDNMEAEGNFHIHATVSDRILSRGLEGTVTKSDSAGYRFSYPAQKDAYHTTSCTFNSGTGLATATDGHFLTWADVENAVDYTFLLDNVPYNNNVTDELYGVQFSDKEKQRYAAGMDNEKATNDIVWGQCKVTSRESVELKFDLYHRMTRLSVHVTSSSADELKNASVELTKVILCPENFNRLTGEIGVAADPLYESILLRKGEQDWESEPVAGENVSTTNHVYKTIPFIFPPQRLREGEERPRLRISMIEGGEQVTYSAALPTALTVTTADGVTSSMQLSRLTAGQHLTLNVTLLHDGEKPMLEFRPAVVERWKDLGSHTIVANKAGIYDASNLPELIMAYNLLKQATDENSKKESHRKVARYGTEKEGKWTFNLFANLEFPNENASLDELFCDNNFTFNMYGHSITIDGMEYKDNVQELVDRLTQNSQP
ncbi:fimbrillin family protein [Bacteroides caecimuris]|jgi:hypothetical protein|nr:fimbrillin family protein [Bacteroides caecimuris]